MPLKNQDAVVGEVLTGPQGELWQLLGNVMTSSSWLVMGSKGG